jgi:hypothetical protein
MSIVRTADHTFRVESDLVDVTSMHRPDPSWLFTDANGHTHRWFLGDKPAVNYSPSDRYTLPSLSWVEDPPTFTEDGDEIPQGHYVCAACGETIRPGYTADDTQQFMPGLKRYYLDDRPVSEPVFMEAAKSAGLLTASPPESPRHR